MYKLFIAFRYLTSRPISLVSIAGISLSVGALIVVVSVMSGFLRETKSFIRGTMSDLVVTPIRYLSRVEGGLTSGKGADLAELCKTIKAVPGVTGVSPRFVRPALIRRSDGVDPYAGSSKFSDINFTKTLGIDIQREREVSRINDFLEGPEHAENRVASVEEPFLVPDDKKDSRFWSADFPSILVGEDKFEQFGLRVGSVLTLATLDASTLKATLDKGKDLKAFEQKFFVAGAFRSGNHRFDMEFVIIEMTAAWDWVGVPGEVSEVYVSIEDYDARGLETRGALVDALNEADIPARVETWEERNSIFLGAVKNERTILGVILAFFILIATFNVYATISMMVTDKTKDIGILVSMGATSFGIMKTFVICGLFMWLIGSILGVVAGYFFADNINAIKDGIEATLGIEVFDHKVYNFKEIPVEISGLFMSVIVAGTFLMCLFFSLIPSLRASWMHPVKALRHE